MSQAAIDAPGAACQPNISPAGVRRRRVFGTWNVALGVVLALVLAAFHARWFWRLSVFFPVALAAVGFLQARRRTCVRHAREGTFEHDDFSTTPADAGDLRRSRVVAAGITRDAILLGVAVAVVYAVLGRV